MINGILKMDIKEKFDKVYDKIPGYYFGILIGLIGAITIVISAILFSTVEQITFFTHWISNLGGATVAFDERPPNGSNVVFGIGLVSAAICAIFFLIYALRILIPGNEKTKWMLHLDLITGLIAIIGIIIVSFFDMINWLAIHGIGAAMFFIGGMFMVLFFTLTILLNSEIPWIQAIPGFIVSGVFLIFLITFLPHLLSGVELISLLADTSNSVYNWTRFWEWMVLFAILSWFFIMGYLTYMLEK